MTWILPSVIAVLAIVVLLPNLFVLEDSELYPVQSDSAKYDTAAVGVARFIEELPTALPKLFSGQITPEDRDRYDWNSGILQHAASYVIPLGVTYASFGHSETAGRVLTILFVAASAALLVVFTQSNFGPLAASLAGIAFVLWPAHVRFGTAIMTEMPMVFWAFLAVVGMERTRRSTALMIAVGGALLGGATLAKYSLRYLIVPFLLVDFFQRGSGPGRLRFLALRCVGVLTVLAIWGGFLRGADMPTSGIASGFETELFLFRGNYPEDRGFESAGLGDVNVPVILEAAKDNPAQPGLETTDERMRRIYLDSLRRAIGEEPTRWAALVLAKAGWFWRYPGVGQDVPSWFGPLPPPSRLQIGVAFLGLVGLGFAIVRGGIGYLPVVIFAYLTALHAGTHLVGRYNIPAVALMIPYAAGGLVLGASALRRLRPDTVPFLRTMGGGERVAALVWLALLLVTALVPRDVWVAVGLPVLPAHLLTELLAFGAYVAFGTLLVLRLRSKGIFWVRAGVVGLLPVVWGLCLLGDAHADRDRDVWEARLSQAGDRVVQILRLPDDLEWRAVQEAGIYIDMMEDAGSDPEVIVRVDGVPVRHFAEGLENPDEDYLLDSAVHAVQNRYRRIHDVFTRQLDEYLRRRLPDADLSYFPQWFRIPVSKDVLEGRKELVIEIELVDPGGGGVTIFGDGNVETARGGAGERRSVDAPAFLENPYELSSYQFALFATDRRRADVRFVRPLPLYSVASEGEFYRGGNALEDDLSPSRGSQRGEYRIRLRTRLHGYYVRRERGDRRIPVWAVYPKPEERPVSSDELRVLSARRHSFFGGWRSY